MGFYPNQPNSPGGQPAYQQPYQQPMQQPRQPPLQQPYQPPDVRGFFGSLFDFSFRAFITPKLIKLLFALFTIFAALATLAFIAAAFRANSGLGVVALLIVGPLLFLFYVIIARVYLELIIILFRIEEHTAVIARKP